MRWGLAIILTIATASWSSRSSASPSAKLVYVRSAGTEACPDEAELRRAVASRVGYDPFFPVAQKTVIAQVTRAANGYRARVQIVAEDGKVRGEREIATKGQDCGELVGAIALAISVALDDFDDAPAPPPDPPAPAVDPSPSPGPEKPPREDLPAKPPPAAAPPGAKDESRVDLAGLAGIGILGGTAPAAAVSGQIAATIGVGPLGLRIDARADAPSGSGLDPTGRLSTSSFVGLASVCVRGRVPFFCAGGGLGWISIATEGLANPRSDGAGIGVAALRAGVRIHFAQRFFLEPSALVGGNLVRHEVVVDGRVAYELPFFWGGASLLAGVDFL